MSKNNLLEVHRLSKTFNSRFGNVLAVNNISFDLAPGEILCLIGQSGSGKSTVANTLMHLESDATGLVFLKDKVVSGRLSRREQKSFYRKVQLIFQDPHSSLNGKHNIFYILSEPLRTHKIGHKWTIDFLKSDRNIFKTFSLSFEREYLLAKAGLLEFYIKKYDSVAEEIRREIAEWNINFPQISDSAAQKEAAFSRLVSVYYDTLIGFENSHFGLLNSEVERLTSFYIDTRQKVARRDLPWDEVALINAQEELQKYVDSFDDKIINRREKELLKSSKHKIYNLQKATNRVLRSLKSDRKSKARLAREHARLEETREGYNRNIKLFKKYRNERRIFSILSNNNLIISRDDLLSIDDDFNNDRYKDLKVRDVVKLLYDKYHTDSSAIRKQIHQEQKELIAVISTNKGASIVPDPEVLAKLRAKLTSAQNDFESELVKAKVEFETFKTTINEKIAFFENKIASSIWKERDRSLNNDFTVALRRIYTLSKGRELRERKTLHDQKLIQYESHIYETRMSTRSFKKIEIIYNIRKLPKLARYFFLKKLLVTRAVMSSLRSVGLKAEHAYRYPHEFSGGQKQRINIARALILEPELIIADEPVASLDVSIQAQIINVLVDLVRNRNISMIFIGHDLSIVRYLATSILVMHNGRIVERGYSEPIFVHPFHPYTKSLFAAIPKLSNANTPFRSQENQNAYLLEYANSAPREQLVEPHHLVLANDQQMANWRKDYKQISISKQNDDNLDTFELIVKKNDTLQHDSKHLDIHEVAKVINPVSKERRTAKVVDKKPVAKHEPKNEEDHKNIIIAFNDNKWFVRTDGARAHKSFALQTEAIVYGKSMARKNGSVLIVESRDGKPRVKFSYQKKPWKGQVDFK